MDIAVFTPSRPADDFNGLPSPCERRSAPLFWGWVHGMFSGELLPEPADDGADWRIQAMRRREAAIAALNGPKPPTPLQAIAGDVVDMVKDTVGKVAKVSKLLRS